MTARKIACLVMMSNVLFLPGAARAQTALSGAIAGEVKDTTGALLPGVTVEAASPALIEKVRTVVTDGQGRYQIVDLRPGPYTVTFSLAGFSTVRREGIDLSTGFTANVTAEMKIGSLAETITVSGASPVVDTQNVRSQNVLSRQALDALPTGRSYYGHAALTVGVYSAVSGGGQDVGGTIGDAHGYITVDGSSAADRATNIDGMTFNTLYGAIGGSTKQYFINQAATREVVVETSGMQADTAYGGVGINAVPKDGGNLFSVYFNTNYSSKNLQQANLDDALRARGVTTESPIKRVYGLEGGLGGPIRRDALWFYTAHRWSGSQSYAPANFYNATHGTMFYTPDPGRQAFTDFYQQDHTLRLTWQAAPKHKVTLSFSDQKNCACNY